MHCASRGEGTRPHRWPGLRVRGAELGWISHGTATVTLYTVHRRGFHAVRCPLRRPLGLTHQAYTIQDRQILLCHLGRPVLPDRQACIGMAILWCMFLTFQGFWCNLGLRFALALAGLFVTWLLSRLLPSFHLLHVSLLFAISRPRRSMPDIAFVVCPPIFLCGFRSFFWQFLVLFWRAPRHLFVAVLHSSGHFGVFLPAI